MHEPSQGTAFSPDMYQDAAATTATIEATSTRHETPCGAGHMVWRRWGSGPPVVLVHGGGGSWTHWLKNIAPLSERHTVWAIDIPGLGESAMPDPLSVEAIGETVERGLRMLIPGDGLVDLVGFSFGTSISTIVAARLKSRVRNLVLAGARFAGNSSRVRPRLLSWRKSDDASERLAMHRRNLELLMFADPGKIDALAVHLQSNNTVQARYSGRKLTPGQNEKMREYLPQVRVQGRVTGISGTLDEGAILIMHEQEAALQSMQPTARFVKIEDAGHWVQYEAAEQFNDFLRDALSAGVN